MVENSQNTQSYVIQAKKLVSIACGTLEPGFVTVSEKGLITHVGSSLREEDEGL
jgi:hypothetical protein